MKGKLLFLLSIFVGSALPTSCADNGWWTKTANLTINDIGKIEKIHVNGLNYNVRLIGIDHDDLSDGSGKAHTTWEFVNVLCDSNGYSLGTIWNWDNGINSKNDDYLNSNLRKALDGGGNGELVWYQKGSKTRSTKYNKSALDMLPKRLKNNLKEVVKPFTYYDIPTGTYKLDTTSYKTKVFTFSQYELFDQCPFAFKEGHIYDYYYFHNSFKYHFHVQIKHEEYHLDEWDYPHVEDGKFPAPNRTGFYKDNKGGEFWLRTPSHIDEKRNYSHFAEENGDSIFWTTYNQIIPVVPVFCI